MWLAWGLHKWQILRWLLVWAIRLRWLNSILPFFLLRVWFLDHLPLTSKWPICVLIHIRPLSVVTQIIHLNFRSRKPISIWWGFVYFWCLIITTLKVDSILLFESLSLLLSFLFLFFLLSIRPSIINVSIFKVVNLDIFAIGLDSLRWHIFDDFRRIFVFELREYRFEFLFNPRVLRHKVYFFINYGHFFDVGLKTSVDGSVW